MYPFNCLNPFLLGTYCLQSLSADGAPSKNIKTGHYRPTSETPFEWRFTGGPMVAQDCRLAG